MEPETETQKENANSSILDDEWLIRDYSVYDGEYSDCTSIRSRFHQYFVHGQTLDCTQWRRDADNCYKWEKTKDLKAAKELVNSEKQRRLTRLKAHYSNTTWDKRKSPPEDWNKPLPESMQAEYENSYLNFKNKEMKGELEPIIDTNKMCSVM